MNSVLWQCFIESRESMYHVRVIAPTAEEAAVEAAKTTGISGIWKIVHGSIIEVEIIEKQVFTIRKDRIDGT